MRRKRHITSDLLDVLAPVMDHIPWTRRGERRIILTTIHKLLPGVRRPAGVSVLTHRYLFYVVLPLWLGTGFADYIFHRRTKIERTSGTRESAIHMLLMTEVGIPLLAGLFFEVNALILLLMWSMFIIHEATAYWDIHYTEARRPIPPNEQHTHSYLEVIPFMALSMTTCLNWEQTLALLGLGPEPPKFRLRPRRPPVSRRYVLGILTAAGLLEVLPHVEELVRCYLNDPTLAPTPPVASEPVGDLPVDAAARAR